MSEHNTFRQAKIHNDICDMAGVVALRRLGLVEDSYVEAAFANRTDDERQEIENLVNSMFAAYQTYPEQAQRDERGANYWRILFGQEDPA